jgi:hypothetical protein
MQARRLASRAPALVRWLRAGALVTLTAILTGCASFYVDPTLPQVRAEQIRKPAAPQPTQLLVEFQTNGAANARATEHVAPIVQKAVVQSGLFSEVKKEPTPSQALLTVTINNIGDVKQAAAKGFVTGLTFGLAGSAITDGYICTIRYARADGAAFSTKVEHALITAMGAGSAPAGLQPAASAQEAIEQIMSQMVLTGMQRLSIDPAFAK